ncbi:MAG TPA: hypothetical protein PK295_00380 [Candidatus Magasanikbacteria bacterium]|nr:hypothetical protein [Candidatus Magasanikbacteria bacterium]
MKLTFPPKKLQIKYALSGLAFGMSISLILFILNHVMGYLPDTPLFFFWRIFVGLISVIWLISYFAIGSWLPFVVTSNAVIDPALWVIALPSVIFYVFLFWFVGNILWIIKNRKSNNQPK